jgi:hypothetical protein
MALFVDDARLATFVDDVMSPGVARWLQARGIRE